LGGWVFRRQRRTGGIGGFAAALFELPGCSKGFLHGALEASTTKSQFETYLYVSMFLDSGSHRRTKVQ
jgi:hypothetical protein